jgi:hypothetical protein
VPTPGLSAGLDQVVGRADAGQHEQLRAVDRAAAQDDLAVGQGGLALAVPKVGHAGGAPALDEDLGDQGVGVHGEVRPGHGRVQVGDGGRASAALALGHLVPADAVLARSVEVRVGRRPLLARGADERLARR